MHGIKAVELLKGIAKMGGKLDIYLLQTLIAEYGEKVKRLKTGEGNHER
jgi:hypothetical protein